MLDAAALLSANRGNIRFLVSAAPSVGRSFVEKEIAASPACGAAISLTEAPVRELFDRCTVVVAVSGTVTLEAALAAVPTVIIYRISPVSYWTGRLMIRVPYIGLANLIAGRQVMPELIQEDATAGRIAQTVDGLLSRPERLSGMRNELLKVRGRLGRPGAASRVADIAMEMIGDGKLKPGPRTRDPELRLQDQGVRSQEPGDRRR
jgi:lipid-A-disaccharide synthase